ncbi:hypothetical protein CS009_00500 [Streptococcus macedonicus]|uniref:HTH gntR-type domain-containing protein n=1 Tax=Streptococcus macedonicus TaxID=59310 RepID=A0AAP8G060_STRMC|nr:hypothetical protein CS009_00500 [Streptococcus macedonicus]
MAISILPCLPSERDLADDYEVSRMTLRQAIMS